jgi:hypothetical protein
VTQENLVEAVQHRLGSRAFRVVELVIGLTPVHRLLSPSTASIGPPVFFRQNILFIAVQNSNQVPVK